MQREFTTVTNKTANGFDVIELNHGTSNTAFSWHIVANRANEAGANHDYAERRFPVGPKTKDLRSSNPNSRAAANNGAKPATKQNISALANHKGTSVKQPTPIKNTNNSVKNVAGRSSTN